MKNIICLLIITFSFSNNLFSQQQLYIQTLEEFYTKRMIEKSALGNDLGLSEIKGSPYLNDQFLNGEVLTTSNTKYIGVPLRYNIYSDAIEFEGLDKKAYQLEKSIIKNVKIDTTEFVYRAHGYKNILDHSFFEVLEEGKVTLLKQYHVRFEDKQAAKPFADPIPAKFIISKADYYISLNESEIQKISNQKELIKILPNKKPEMEAFIKTNKLKIGDQEDLIKIIHFYNKE